MHLTNEVALCGFAQGSSEREAIATEEMSTLVNYVQPTKFNSFEASKSKTSGMEHDTSTDTLIYSSGCLLSSLEHHLSYF